MVLNGVLNKTTSHHYNSVQYTKQETKFIKENGEGGKPF